MKYFFCGIAGIGMSSIAKWLAFQGHTVCGSDRSFDLGENLETLALLQKQNITIYNQDGSGVTPDVDFLITSSAVEVQIPDVLQAQKLGIPIKKRAELLAQIFHAYKGIAIAGTSGKTTITAMVGHILYHVHKNPTVFNGGISINTYHGQESSNLQLGNGDIAVIEADESDGTIELYHPQISVVSNISLDHKSLKELHPLFENFVLRTQKGVVLNADDAESRPLLKLHPNTLTFSIRKKTADFYATQIKQVGFETKCTINGQACVFPFMGKHNIQNALAAAAVCSLAGVPLEKSLDALKTFKGTKRRLEKIGQAGNICVFDDYAHNPEKIAASLSTLKKSKGRLFAIYQPHGFAPTRLTKDKLVETFLTQTRKKDFLLFAPIFYRGGTVDKSISSDDIVRLLSTERQAFAFQKREDIIPFVAQKVRPNDTILVMGARDNSLTDFARDILNKIKDKK